MKKLARHGVALIACAGLLLISACSTQQSVPTQPLVAQPLELPRLALSPSSLGREVALQQSVLITAPDGSQKALQALLEVDAHAVRLALVHMGQSLAQLHWDGQQLQVQRSRYLPAQVQPERVLSDLQLALWPPPAIAAQLPAAWRLEVQSHGERSLYYQDVLQVKVQALGAHAMEMVYVQQGWRMQVTTVESLAQPVGQGGQQ